MMDRVRADEATEDIGGPFQNVRKRHLKNSVSCWKDLSYTDKEAALKKGFEENAGRYMIYCGTYLRGTGKGLGFFGQLARMTRSTFALIEGALGAFMLGSAGLMSFYTEDMESMSEALHFFLMVTNISCILLDFLHKRDIFDRLFTSVGAGFFSYGHLIDEETKKQMEESFAEMRMRKKLRMKAFAFLVWSCGLVTMGKLVVGYLRFGDRVDGAGGTVLKRQVVPLWFPGVERWPMYLLAAATCYIGLTWVVLSVCALVLPWIGFVEELTAQLDAVGLGLRRLTTRARHLYITRYGNERVDKAKYSKCVEEALKASVIHHVTILEYGKSN